MLHIVDTVEEAREVLPGFEDDMRGLCSYDHDSKQALKCVVVVKMDDGMVSRALLVHELVHAALEWVNAEVMPVAQKYLKDDEIDGHYHESVARVVEALVEQCS